MISRRCEDCGGPFKAWPYVVAKGAGRFCSRRCGYNQIGATLSVRVRATRPAARKVEDYWLLPVDHGGWTKVSQLDVIYLDQFGWSRDGGGYPVAKVGGRKIQLHRLVMERQEGRKLLDSELVDHKHRNKLDNRRSELRIATYSQNVANTGLSTRNKSGYKGVTRCTQTGKWRMVVGGEASTGRQIRSKRSDDRLYLANLYDQFASQIFGEFAVTNFTYFEVPRQD